jgi:hypothetical protein
MNILWFTVLLQAVASLIARVGMAFSESLISRPAIPYCFYSRLSGYRVLSSLADCIIYSKRRFGTSDLTLALSKKN